MLGNQRAGQWSDVDVDLDVDEYQALLGRARELYRADRFADARAHLDAALRVGERVFGKDALELVTPLKLSALALAEGTFGDHNLEGQLALHERVLAITEHACGASDRRTGAACYAVGLDLWGLARREEALDCFRRALAIAKWAHDDEHYVVREVRGALGTLLSELGRHDEAIALLLREVEIAETHTHAGSRMVAHWYLGQALLRARRWAESARSLELALALADARPRGGGAQAEQLRAWLNAARANLAQAASP
jgi:tetratricopeptide (TPR) repeat protein